MNDKQIICDGCGTYIEEFFISEYKDDKKYCIHCKHKMADGRKTTKESDFDKMLKAALKTPPLKLKDLKEKLKREREKKRNSESKRHSK